MKNYDQVFSHYTGYKDGAGVIQDATSHPSEEFAMQIAGKAKYVANKFNRNIPTFTFFKRNNSGVHEETYYVKGGFYITETDPILRPIGELKAVFGNHGVMQIAFTGVYYRVNHGLIQMVGVNDKLFVTDSTHAFVSVGQLSTLIPAGIQFITFVGTPLSPDYYAFDEDGKAYHVTISMNDSHVPTIHIGNQRAIPTILMGFRPTSCNVEPTGVSGQAKMSFVNSSWGKVTMLYTEPTVHTTSTQLLNVDEGYLSEISTGIAYNYEVTKNHTSGDPVAVPAEIITIQDDTETISVATYNSALQQTRVEKTIKTLVEPAHTFSEEQKTERNILYLWESSQSCAGVAAKVGKSLIAEASEKVQQSGISSYSYYNKYDFMTRGNSVYYIGSYGVDGLLEDQETQQELILAWDDSGAPTLVDSIRPYGQTHGNITKYIYTKNKCTLPIAAFSGLNIDTSERTSAHYLGFETYEDFNISNSALTSTHFSAANVQVVDDAYLGSHALRFTGSSSLMCSSAFYVEASATYHFSCYRKDSENGAWKYFEKIIDGSTLESSRIIHDFASGQTIDYILLKAVDCTADITIYDPTTFHLLARVDNNGVITRYWSDSLGRIQFSYKEKLESDTASQYYAVSSNCAAQGCTIVGYNRFDGFNCTSSGLRTASGNNSAMKILFHSEGLLIPSNGGEVAIGKSTALVASAKAEEGQHVQFVRTSDTIDFRFNANTVTAYVNNVLVATSEAVLMGKSSWIILARQNHYAVVLNGKIVLSIMFAGTHTIDKIQTAETDDTTSHYIIVKDYDYEVDYLDFNGHVIQSQRLRNDSRGELRVVTNANFYDGKGNLIVETLRAAFPNGTAYLTTEDEPMKYRSSFASLDWSDVTKSRGVLTGELKTYYQSGDGVEFVTTNQDYNWPYVQRVYEGGSSNRLESVIWQGERGEKSSIKSCYHNVDTFNQLVGNYTGTDSINYASKAYTGENTSGAATAIMMHEMFNNYGQCYSKKAYGSQGTSATQVLYGVQNGLITLSSPASTKGHTHILYSPTVLSDVRSSVSLLASKRLHVNFGIDYENRIILYDSYGNARLAVVNGHDSAVYAKYDIHNRIIECGTIQLPEGQTIYAYYNAVNNPVWPTGSGLSVNTLYEYEYDYFSDSNVFARGRLVSVINHESQLRNNYSYDYLGRVVDYKDVALTDTQTVLNEVRYNIDCVGNIQSIVYPTESYSTATYTYDEFGRAVSITIRKNTTVLLVFNEGKYDLYDRLISYKNSNAKTIFRKHDFYSNLTQMGEIDGKTLTKTYDDAVSPYRLTRISENDGTSTDIGYNNLGWILSQTGANPYSCTYDNSGNIQGIVDGAIQYNCTYEGNKLKNVKKSDGTTTAILTYDAAGAATSYSHSLNLTFDQDAYFAGKVAQVHLTGITNQHHKYTYDWRGRLLRQFDIVTTNTNSLYIYGYQGQMVAEYTGSLTHIASLFIYVGNLLICAYDPNNVTCTNYIYDQMNTLRYVGYDNEGTYYSTFVHYTNPWGKVSGDGSEYRYAKFLYAGMEYLWEFGVYNHHGVMYIPEYGVMSAPSIELKHSSPYRIFNNDAIR